jgi:hypothetical protein
VCDSPVRRAPRSTNATDPPEPTGTSVQDPHRHGRRGLLHIFAQPNPEAVSATWDEVRDQLTNRSPKIAPLIDDAKTEVLAFTAFPRACASPRFGAPTRWNGSTRRSSAEPAWSASFQRRRRHPARRLDQRYAPLCAAGGSPEWAHWEHLKGSSARPRAGGNGDRWSEQQAGPGWPPRRGSSGNTAAPAGYRKWRLISLAYWRPRVSLCSAIH